jgi:predicted small metal-binding protein
MTRSYLECRGITRAHDCSLSIAADDEQELLEAAVQHLVSVHRERDTPELRRALRERIEPERLSPE